RRPTRGSRARRGDHRARSPPRGWRRGAASGAAQGARCSADRRCVHETTAWAARGRCPPRASASGDLGARARRLALERRQALVDAARRELLLDLRGPRAQPRGLVDPHRIGLALGIALEEARERLAALRELDLVAELLE